jgi:hypothetical protein
MVFATMPQIPKVTAMMVTGMKMSGAFFFGLYSSPRRGFSKRLMMGSVPEPRYDTSGKEKAEAQQARDETQLRHQAMTTPAHHSPVLGEV